MALLPVKNSNAGAIVSLVTVCKDGKACGFNYSWNSSKNPIPILSANGQQVVFQWGSDIFIRDILARKTKMISTNVTMREETIVRMMLCLVLTANLLLFSVRQPI
ncbi:hypothetical protein CRENPOLYSF1_1320006 [Crenothrix polyspora]|uniref:Uncharacterized protein n=1 Tax=Crenothrix polyspora TaxID=360316 RepID=A0A1R4H2G7_9GAMM|nr:hypothetical protein CRENPOLYSF1_1320006 [Crenothrix polyspora]